MSTASASACLGHLPFLLPAAGVAGARTDEDVSLVLFTAVIRLVINIQ